MFYNDKISKERASTIEEKDNEESYDYEFEGNSKSKEEDFVIDYNKNDDVQR